MLYLYEAVGLGVWIFEHCVNAFLALEIAGSIPGVTFEEMKLQIKLGVPHPLQQVLDIERVKSVFP